MKTYIPKKRTYANPSATITMFLIPLMTYLMGKGLGVKYNSLEWIWIPIILSMFILWFLINFKIERK